MNVHYEELNNKIKLIHDLNSLDDLKRYNSMLEKLFYSLMIEDTDKNIFECCREFLNYLKQMDNVIDNQITYTIQDMRYSHQADED